VRIGKQYRIAQEDLQAFTGRAAAPAPRDEVRRERYVEVSSIVQIDALSPELASRITNGLMAAANGRRGGEPALRIDSQYDETRGKLKVIVTGALATTASLLGFIDLYLE
jgi:hypothetical protein